MTDYISRGKLLDAMQSALDQLPQNAFNPNKIGFLAAMEGIKNFPAADVVPMDFHERCLQIEIKKRMALEKADVRGVVYCKDCRHRDPEDHKCDCGGTERQGCPFKVADDYFCAYGER